MARHTGRNTKGFIMQKEMDARYYDAVVSRDKKHQEKWIETGRKGHVVILETRRTIEARKEQPIEPVKAATPKKRRGKKSKRRVDLPKVRESEQP